MGMLDHRGTWNYEVKASPKECVDAFVEAFAGSGGLVAKANWRVTRRGNGAVAVYEGRKGLAALIGAMSQTATNEHESAIGSEVKFEVDGQDGGRTSCSMWLASSGRAGVGGLLGATSDARFIRPYMQAVAKTMRTLDPSASITKQ